MAVLIIENVAPISPPKKVTPILSTIQIKPILLGKSPNSENEKILPLRLVQFFHFIIKQTITRPRKRADSKIMVYSSIQYNETVPTPQAREALFSSENKPFWNWNFDGTSGCAFDAAGGRRRRRRRRLQVIVVVHNQFCVKGTSRACASRVTSRRQRL